MQYESEDDVIIVETCTLFGITMKFNMVIISSKRTTILDETAVWPILFPKNYRV